MSDDSKPPPSPWLKWFGRIFNRVPEDRLEVLQTLRDAEQKSLINMESLSMLEGVLQVSEMQVRDIMIPRTQMVLIEYDMALPEILSLVIESSHSRFPVIGDNRDDIEGILLAKDLLPVLLERVEKEDQRGRFDLKDILRPSVIVPESKRLDVLLKEFRSNRNHMAIVVDEYGCVAGLVTIEDVLEQIVGEIEDEHDIDDEDDFIKSHSENEFMIKAQTPIEEFNDFFQCQFSDDEFDTIGGLIIQAFGHMPARDEEVSLNGFKFTVVSSDTRRIGLLRAEKLKTQDDNNNVDTMAS